MSENTAPYATTTAPRACCFTGPGLPSASACRNCPSPPTLPDYKLPTPEQQALFSEARLGQECGLWLAAAYPAAYALFFHIPNGGLRTAVESAGFKLQHAKAGVPDCLLALPALVRSFDTNALYWHGLFIELKTATGRVAPAQTAWHERLRQQGYRCEVVRSLPDFIQLLTDYLQ